MKKGSQKKSSRTKPLTTNPSVSIYDSITMDIEQSDALALHLEERLSELHHQDQDLKHPELLALSIIALEVSNIHQRIRTKTLHLYESLTGKEIK